jgi:hypothetical protein
MKQSVISSEARGLKAYSVTVSERSERGSLKFEDVERPSSILHPKDEKDRIATGIKGMCPRKDNNPVTARPNVFCETVAVSLLPFL